MIKNKSEKDEYAWLESDSKRTKTWIQKEVDKTSEYFQGNSLIKKFNKRFSELLNVDSELLPIIKGDYHFFRHRKPQEEQHSLYMRKGISGKPTLLLDSKIIGKKFGTIHDWHVARNGKYIAIQFSKAGNDDCEVRVLEVKSKKFLKDVIPYGNYPRVTSWNTDSSGFWYVKSLDTNKPQEKKFNKRVYFHSLDTDHKKDPLIFGEHLDKADWPFFACSPDGKTTIINIRHKDETAVVIN